MHVTLKAGVKLPFIFVCVQSQIAVWALQRMRHVVSVHAHVRISTW